MRPLLLGCTAVVLGNLHPADFGCLSWTTACGCEEFVVRERVSRAEFPSMSWLKDRAAWVEAMQLKEQEKLSTLACRGQTVQ